MQYANYALQPVSYLIDKAPQLLQLYARLRLQCIVLFSEEKKTLIETAYLKKLQLLGLMVHTALGYV